MFEITLLNRVSIKTYINTIVVTLLMFLFTTEVISGREIDEKKTIVIVPNVFNTIKPINVQNAQDAFVSDLIYEPLFQVNSYGNVIPVLAKGWKYNKDKKELVINIHQEHRFSDGQIVESKHVVKSLKDLCLHHPAHLSHLYYTIQGCNKKNKYKASIRKIEKFKLAIEINSQPSIVLYQLATQAVSIFKNSNGKFFGSGPYAGVLLQNGNLKLNINQYFHDLDSIKNSGLFLMYKPEKDTKENLKLYKPAGSIMLLSYMGGRVENHEYHKVRHVPYVVQTLVLNPKKYPFDNLSFRRLIQADFYNKGRLHTCAHPVSRSYGFIPNGIGGSFSKLPSTIPDNKQNKLLSNYIFQLKKRHVNLTIYRHLGRKNTCEETRITEVLRNYNISVNFIYHTDYKKLTSLFGSKDTQAYIELFVFYLRDSSKVLSRFASNSVNQNLFFWTSESIKELLIQASNKPSLHARFPIYRDINRIIHNNANVIDLYYVGHTNYFHHCYELAQPTISFNPNSFYLLKSLQRKENCIIN